MFYDPRLPTPRTEDEASVAFVEAWAVAEAAIASRKQSESFRAKWARLSGEAQGAINRAVRAEWGDDLDMGDMLARATHGWDGYNANELRAEALRPVIAWWEATHGTVTYWTGNAGSSKFVLAVMKIMRGHDQAKHFATPASIRTLLGHIGR